MNIDTCPIGSSGKPILIIGAAPLVESQYTGIANVVYELARRFLEDENCPFEVHFSAFEALVDRSIIRDCIADLNGKKLVLALETGVGVGPIPIDEARYVAGRPAYGLFLHIKPPQEVYLRDAVLFYDFSFLLTQECHTRDTVVFHTNGLIRQIETTALFFTISESTSADLQFLFNVPPEKIVVALLGANADMAKCISARALIGNRLVEDYFLILGTIEPRKNIDIVFEWIKCNPGILKRFRFIFAGRQGWGPGFSEYIDKYHLTDAVETGRIVHFGYVDEALKATLITSCSAVIYPSLFEGFGLPVLEAMQMGAPVIASCSTSIPEVLGDAGYYFDPYSSESFDQAFTKFLRDKMTGNISTIQQQALTRAMTFSYDKTYQAVLNGLISAFLVNPDMVGENCPTLRLVSSN